MFTQTENVFDEDEGDVSRKRIDYTVETPVSKRRLDALARLLASQSLCVAVSIVNDKLYITANELKKTSRGNNSQITSIKKIANYFRQPGNSSSSSPSSSTINNDHEAFHEICSSKRLENLFKGSLSIPQGVIKGVAQDVLNHSSNSVDIYRYLYEQKNNAMIAGLAYGEFTKLYRDFTKLKKTLITEGNNDNEDDFEDSASQISEIKTALTQEPVILREETEEGIHAEVQLLSCILKDFETQKEKHLSKGSISQYIGISKLCCFHCSCMLEAANKVFMDNEIPIKIEFRGSHNLDFKWQPPHLFTEGFKAASDDSSSASLEEHSVAYKIGKLAAEKISEHSDLKSSRPKGVQQQASQSDSDTDSIAEAELQGLVQQLQSKWSFLQAMSDQEGPSTTLIEIINKVKIAEQLFTINNFRRLYELDAEEDNADKISRAFVSVGLVVKNTDGSSVSSPKLLKILQDSNLVGEKASGLFKKISPATLKGNDSKQEMQREQSKPLSSSVATLDKPLAPLIFSGSHSPKTTDEKILGTKRKINTDQSSSSAAASSTSATTEGIEDDADKDNSREKKLKK